MPTGIWSDLYRQVDLKQTEGIGGTSTPPLIPPVQRDSMQAHQYVDALTFCQAMSQLFSFLVKGPNGRGGGREEGGTALQLVTAGDGRRGQHLSARST